MRYNRANLILALAAAATFGGGQASAQGRAPVATEPPARAAQPTERSPAPARPLRFDGRRMNQALANAIAGERPLAQWSDCTFRMNADGRPELLQPGATTSGLTAPLACLYLAFQVGDRIDEYFLTDLACGDLPERFCLGGYRIDTWIETRLHRNNQRSADWHLVVDATVRTLVDPRLARQPGPATIASRPGASTAPGAGARAANLDAAVSARGGGEAARWHGHLRIEQRHRFAGSSHYWEYEIRDRTNRLIEGPLSGGTNASEGGGGGDGCATLGNSVTHVGSAATTLVAGLFLAGSVATGAMIGGVVGGSEGAVAGGVVGSAPGAVGGMGGAAVAGAGFGAMVGGLGGTAGAAMITASGMLASQAAGSVATAVCRLVTSVGGPAARPTFPPLTPDERLELDMPPWSCLVCKRWAGSTSYIDDKTGEVIVEQHRNPVCMEWELNTNGTDSNDDGWCD
ncbi:MAG: hypothetical protein KF823_04295 [Xanthomonadales bacterium]|nr:hypothetical protein [Xanthomonadales bacterium]